MASSNLVTIMYAYFATLLSLLLLTTSSTTVEEPMTGTLCIKIDNIKSRKGSIRIGLYDSEQYFMNKDGGKWSFQVQQFSSGSHAVEIPSMTYGTYALAIYQDLNNNNELDRNVFGVPTEPYAFSNDPNHKLRGPTYEEVKFRFMENRQTVSVDLKSWRERF